MFFPRSQRLQFDVSSPNGILLFRETSKMITTYGTFTQRFGLLLASYLTLTGSNITKYVWRNSVETFLFCEVVTNADVGGGKQGVSN